MELFLVYKYKLKDYNTQFLKGLIDLIKFCIWL